MSKPKRHIRKSLLIIICVALLILLGCFLIPTMLTKNKLKQLGYDKASINKILELNIQDQIISRNYYSDYLAQSIKDGSINVDYLFLYTIIPSDRTLSDSDFVLYNRLCELGYENDQIKNLYSQLEFYEITPLLVFDYQWDESDYIADCINNRDSNSLGSFTLTSSYMTKYKNENLTYYRDNNTLVNYNYYLPSDYEPSNLVEISTMYAASGQQLVQEAADNYIEMSLAAMNNKTPFFISSSYRSYADQEASYKQMANNVGDNNVDKYAMRAGHSEHQTGLCVNVSATYESNSDFTNTNVYAWIRANCTNYGFIMRYPIEKSSITSVDDEPGHLRYVGKELANKIKESGLTFDEYYGLYLKPWNESKYVPSDSLCTSTNCTQIVMEN